MNPTQTTRNVGIDALRIVSMFMVVVLHMLGRGGILAGATVMSKQFICLWLLEITAYGAVNCYALISGYVGYASKYKVTNIIKLWMQTVFICLVANILVSFLHPGDLTKGDWFNVFFPFLREQYWYMTAYFGMFFLIPGMNLIVKHTQEYQMKLLLAGLFVFYIFFPSVFESDPFQMNQGYSVLWLSFLYLAGACIKKYDWGVKRKKIGLLLGFVCMILITWGSKLFSWIVLEGRHENILVSYTSPTIVIGSVCIFFIFANLQIKQNKLVRLIEWAAPATLGVYLIHFSPMVKLYILTDHFRNMAMQPLGILFLKIAFLVCGVYVGCTLLEKIRIWFFKVSRLNRVPNIIYDAITKILGKTKEGRSNK